MDHIPILVCRVGKDDQVTEDGGITTISTKLIACPDCGGTTFLVFVVPDNHDQVQCTSCGRSFCKAGDERFRICNTPPKGGI